MTYEIKDEPETERPVTLVLKITPTEARAVAVAIFRGCATRGGALYEALDAVAKRGGR